MDLAGRRHVADGQSGPAPRRTVCRRSVYQTDVVQGDLSGFQFDGDRRRVIQFDGRDLSVENQVRIVNPVMVVDDAAMTAGNHFHGAIFRVDRIDRQPDSTRSQRPDRPERPVLVPGYRTAAASRLAKKMREQEHDIRSDHRFGHVEYTRIMHEIVERLLTTQTVRLAAIQVHVDHAIGRPCRVVGDHRFDGMSQGVQFAFTEPETGRNDEPVPAIGVDFVAGQHGSVLRTMRPESIAPAVAVRKTGRLIARQAPFNADRLIARYRDVDQERTMALQEVQDHSERTIAVYELLAADIKAMGVDTVFGLMSDDTAHFGVTLDALGIKFVNTRHENIAITMADGFAAATGRLGVVCVGRGPALANGLHGATFASRTGNPVLIIYGEEPIPGRSLNTQGPDYKGFDAVGVLRSAGIRAFAPSGGETARQVLADAAAAARLGATIAYLLPVNVQLAEISAPRDVAEPEPLDASPARGRPRTPASQQSIAVAADVLARARKPLVLAGYGAHKGGAREALIGIAEKTGALLATSAKGKDMFRGHPFNLGIIGSFSHSLARRMAGEADCVLVVGAGLNILTMSFGESLPSVPLIQVDAVRANIGRWTTADVAVVGDAGLVADQLLAAVEDRPAADKPFHSAETLSLIDGFSIADDFQPANTARTVDPRSLAVVLDRLLPESRNMVYDAGNFLGVVPYLSVPGPAHFKMTNDFASIGLGFGAALGFARGRPDEPTILVIGDGGFLMTLGELETVVREDLPMVIVVMNDCAYGAELHFLRLRQLPVAKSLFPDVDLAPVAEGFGYEAYTVRTLDQLEALAPVLANPDGPIFLDCKINADVAAPFMSEVAAADARR